MKSLLLPLIALTGTAATALASADLTYNVAVRDPIAECAASIRRITKSEGGSVLNVLDVLGIVTVNLSPEALASVERLSCVLSVEKNRSVYPQPRVGRSN